MTQDTRAGTAVNWRAWGDAPPEVLLIHCTLAHAGAWSGMAPLMDRPVVAFDLPGHGRSGPRDPDRDWHDQCVDIALSFMDRPIDLIGHSFGGTIALRLAVERPDLVRRVVLFEPVYFAAVKDQPIFDQHRRALTPFADAIDRKDFALAAKLFTRHWGGGVDWDDMRQEQREVLTTQIQMVPQQDAAIFADTPGVFVPGRLEALNTPVLLMHGEQAHPIMPAINHAIAKRIPDARVVQVPGAGHMAPITHPGETWAEIAGFLPR